MYLDVLTRVSNRQAFTAAAVSADSIDLGVTTPQRPIGTGEPTGFGININVGLAGTSLLVELISALDGALSSNILVHNARTVLAADAGAGALIFLPLPPSALTQRFIGLRVTPTGGAATVTLTAQFGPESTWSIPEQLFPKTYAN